MSDPDRRQQLIANGYDHHLSIGYRFNRQGFRCEDFDQSPCMMALGCSFTSGVGIKEQHIWCHLVSQSLGLGLANLGIQGGSLDTCVRLLYHWLPRLNVKLVCLLEPPPNRFEIMAGGSSDACPRVIAPNFNNRPFESVTKFYYDSEHNSTVNVWKNRLAIAQICAQANVRLVSQDLETGLLRYREDQWQWPAARDMLHQGAHSHRCCADHFVKLIELNQG